MVLGSTNMLLAPFTQHKVPKYFRGFGLRRKEKILGGFHWKLAILRNLDGGILMVERHYRYLKSLRSSGTWMAGYWWLKDTILISFGSFTIPTGIQLALDSIMRLIWCGCKSGIPCSTRDLVRRDMALPFGCTCRIIYKYSGHVLVPAQV
jgi:hypothetical protein